LQVNKFINLKTAAININWIIIKSGEIFSFSNCLLTIKRKGYLPVIELTFGEARAGIGGGICQVPNLVHWFAMHTL
jgi:vancomycin resistance protein VanW